MALDIFTQKLGDDLMPRLDGDNTGLVAVQMLDAIQTVVNVLTDNDGGKGWTVTFDPTLNAYTDRSAARRIVVSGKPLLDAKPGERLDKVAAIMTGFAVHEVGHTKLDFYAAIVKRWPGKKLPITLGNIIEDVVLELRTVERFPGFADNGEGNVFYPTLEWVAERTCPTTPLEWKGSSGHKVNVTGQIVRYRPFVTFANDEATQDALNFVEQWATGITAALGPSGCVTLIEELLDYMKASKEQEEPEAPTPPTTECEFPFGETGQQEIPNEDDDDTEGGDEPGEGGDEPGEDGEDEGPDGEGKGNTEGEDGDDEGGTEGGDDDGEGGDDDGESEDGESRDGDGNDADHENRGEAPTGANDGKGKGGSGQGVADTEEGDVDDGFDEADLDDTFDDLSKVDKDPGDLGQQRRLNEAEQEERVTTRMDAGAFGKMRVVWK